MFVVKGLFLNYIPYNFISSWTIEIGYTLPITICDPGGNEAEEARAYFSQETTGIPGAVNSRRRGRVYPHSRPRPRPNMVIPADNSRPYSRPRRRGRCSVHGPGPGLGQILPPVVY